MISEALKSLKEGGIVLLHDSSGREDEIDMIQHASHVKPETIKRMRKDAGGLICLAIGAQTAKSLNLPYMTQLMEASNETVKQLIPKKTPYGDRPAFSLSINHIGTFTGVTDRDRAKTITEFSKIRDKDELTKNFYAPGHVHLLIAKSLSKRRGHTELSTELAKRAALTQHMVLCEMMADDGLALSQDEAEAYAEKHGLILLDGEML